MNKITLAVDAMGGDHGWDVVIPAVASALTKHPDLAVCLVGDRDCLEIPLKKQGLWKQARLVLHHASEQVAMDESPAASLRYKRDSSMRVALNLLKTQQADACVSAGNTGALMATARFVLKTIPGVDRPAIISPLPTLQRGKTVYMLDLGANVDSSAAHLCQFAMLGSVHATIVGQIDKPKVGLLNVGVEAIKGNELVKETARQLEGYPINYVGFVEGDAVYAGNVDVVVCDGFVGNVALKASEGAIRLVQQHVKTSFLRDPLTRLVGLAALPVLRHSSKRIDPSHYNGASLLGLQGIVIKSHGGADQHAFANAIDNAYLYAKHATSNVICERVEALLKDSV